MNQQGYVIEVVDENLAKLKLKRHSACASCGKCITTHEVKDIVVEVNNSIGAKVGDFVEVSMENINVLKLSMIAYLIPLGGLLLGIVISYYLLNNLNFGVNVELISAIIGVITMFIGFFIIKVNDKKFKKTKEFTPTITKII